MSRELGRQRSLRLIARQLGRSEGSFRAEGWGEDRHRTSSQCRRGVESSSLK
ncbi:hypothetical protein KIP88_20365 [Bradyrhizobium sp. SRL28]|nr:hypothetical protein [Bradyrhizobium sp. SRL28]